jgi:uncharacterized protein (TIGR03000 family)
MRKWFGFASLFAVAVLMLTADAGQAARERRRERRGRGRDYNTYYYDRSPGYYDGSAWLYTGPVDMQTGQRRQFYYDPDVLQTSAREMPVWIDVRIPANAEILFEGQKTTQTGPRRLFVSPPLAPGQNFTYEILAKWMENGREVTQSRKVPVTAGQRVMVDLTRPMQPPSN